MMLLALEEAVRAGARRSRCSELLGLSKRTLERWRSGGEEDARTTPRSAPGSSPRQPPPNKLTAEERAVIVQLVLGFGLFFGGIVYDALVGHMVMMILAAVAANGSAILAPRATTGRQELVMRIAGVVIALVCIVVGILAIGRSVLGSAPATIVQ